MYVKTFQSTDLLGLMESVRSEMGPLAVLLSVRRIELPSGTVLEGAAAVDREALPATKVPEAPRRPVVPVVPVPSRTEQAVSPVQSMPIRAAHPAPDLNVPSRLGAWLKRSAQGFLGGQRTPSKAGVAKAGTPPVIMLVGPAGSGKTTMAAKVAAYLRNREELPTGLVTTDVANSSSVLKLRSCAERLRMPMAAAQSASELRDVLQRWGSRGPLVLDTPGLAAEATETVKTLMDWLHSWIPTVETHLVLAIDSPADRATADLDSFRSAGCQKVMLTHMDRRSEMGVGDETLSEVLSARMPISFLGTGTRVPEDLAIPTPGRLMMAWA